MTAESQGNDSQHAPRRPTLREVAARAGVGLSTASRILNGGSASPELRERVLAAARAIGYQPHAVAQSLRTGSTRTVGFVVPDIANPLFGCIARGAAATLGPAGYSLVLAISDDHREREPVLVATMAARRVDGLLLSCADESDPKLVEALAGLHAPIILLDRDLPAPGAHRVLIEHRQGIAEAVAHLVSLGHRRIAYVGGDTAVRPGRERLASFRAAADAHGLLDEELVCIGGFDHEFGRVQALRLFSRRRPPTAIVSGGNQISTGVLASIREAGKDLPADLSFIGCDDIDALVLNNPPITVVSRSVEEMGTEAARLLLGSLSGEISEPLSHVIYSRLVVRGSTGPVDLRKARA